MAPVSLLLMVAHVQQYDVAAWPRIQAPAERAIPPSQLPEALARALSFATLQVAHDCSWRQTLDPPRHSSNKIHDMGLHNSQS